MSKPTFEVWFSDTKIAHERFSRALFASGARVIDSITFGGPRAIIQFDNPATRARFEAVAMLPQPPRYRSPTVFDHGSLVTMYDSPEDEIAGRVSDRATLAIANNKRREERGR